MADDASQPLSDVLDKLEAAVEGDSVTVGEVVDQLGHSSFAALMLIFSLISTSPASAIPGATAIVGIIVFLLVIQMIAGRDAVWLPGVILRRKLSSDKLCKGVGWLRRPVAGIERLLRPRLTGLFHRPLLYLPLLLVMGLSLVMPLMEAVPMSGSLASGVVALFAASLLTRDGGLAILALALLLTIPLLIWQVGFGG